MTQPGVERMSAPRSRLEWGVRAALAAGAAWLGYGAVNHSLANALRSSSPERAYQLAPDDGGIAAALSSNLSGPDATLQDRARADTLARAALRRDPIAVPALSTLGLNAQIRGDIATARRTFAYVQKLTRRDLRTQLWAIEDAVARGDIPGALNQYDIALRTAREAPNLLFPVLAGAIAEPSVRRALVRVLADKAPWGPDFVIHAAATSPDPRAVVDMLIAMRRAGIEVPEAASQRAVDALVAGKDLDRAWRYYATLRPDVVRHTSRDPRFMERHAAPTLFDWKPVEDAGLTGTIEPSDRGGRFDFAVFSGASGPVLRQMQALPPGAYVIEGVASTDPVDASRPYWSLTCADGPELGRVDAGKDGRFRGMVRVPPGCPVQALTLVARPSDLMAGVTGQVTEARIRPASARP